MLLKHFNRQKAQKRFGHKKAAEDVVFGGIFGKRTRSHFEVTG
jgi:hypothetical protein